MFGVGENTNADSVKVANLITVSRITLGNNSLVLPFYLNCIAE